jgi:hypothetical protein
MKYQYFWPSSIGLLLMAVLVSFLSFDFSNIWIPLSAILVVMSFQTLVTRRNLFSLEARLKQLEAQMEQTSSRAA